MIHLPCNESSETCAHCGCGGEWRRGVRGAVGRRREVASRRRPREAGVRRAARAKAERAPPLCADASESRSGRAATRIASRHCAVCDRRTYVRSLHEIGGNDCRVGKCTSLRNSGRVCGTIVVGNIVVGAVTRAKWLNALLETQLPFFSHIIHHHGCAYTLVDPKSLKSLPIGLLGGKAPHVRRRPRTRHAHALPAPRELRTGHAWSAPSRFGGLRTNRA